MTTRRYQTRRALKARIADLEEALALDRYVSEHTGLVCSVHGRSACRQQIQGGVYKWKPYCNYFVRHDCDMVYAP